MCVCVGGGRLCRWWNTGCALDYASGDACKFVTGVDRSFGSLDLVSILDEMTGFASLACAFEGSKLVDRFYCAFEKKVAYGFVAFERYVVISLKFELFKDGVFDCEVVWLVGGVSEIRLRLFLQSVLLSFLMHLLDAVFSCEDQSIGKVSCCCYCCFFSLKRGLDVFFNLW